MSAAGNLIDRVVAVGASIERRGDRLVVRAGRARVPAGLVAGLRRVKHDVLAVLAKAEANVDLPGIDAKSQADWSPAEWRLFFERRALFRECGGYRSRREAKQLAWLDMIADWHLACGRRITASLCAGCGEPIAGGTWLELADGNQVHLDTLTCLLEHGRRWRAAAEEALIKMGLEPPAPGPDGPTAGSGPG